MKKTVIVMLLAFVAGVSQSSLINWQGVFITGTDTFSYDGETLEAGWVVRMYQSPAATIPSDWQNLAGMNEEDRALLLEGHLQESQVVVDTQIMPQFSKVEMQTKPNLNLTDNIYVFTVLYNSDTVSADAGKALVIGYWDGENEVAVNVGSYDPPEVYTPGDMIPGGGNIILTGNWQAIPEPATALTLFLAMAGIFGLRRLFPKR